MKKLLVFLPFIAVILVLLSMRPIPDPNNNNIRSVQGVVSEVYRAGSDDIVLKLLDDDHFYYIKNNSHLDYTRLKEALLYRDVEISFVKYWSLLNASGSARFMCELSMDDKVVFTALNEN